MKLSGIHVCIRSGLLLRGRCRIVIGRVSSGRRFCAVASNSVIRRDSNTCTKSSDEQLGDESDVSRKNNKLTWQPSKIVVHCRYKNGNGKLPVEVNVFDNQLGHRAPTVVMLLGLVGSGEDFRSMVTYLSSAGIRCVAPEIPGFGDSLISRPDIYNLDFTSFGQSQMLADILDEKGITRVDGVISHSAASWVAVRFGASVQNVRSLTLINPMSIRPNKAMRPYIWTKLVGAAARNRVFWPVVDSYIEIGARRSGFKIPAHKQRQKFVGLETVSTVDFNAVKEDVKTLREKHLPVFVAWSRNDKMIEDRLSRDLLSTLGMHQEIKVKENQALGGSTTYKRELVFESGGHVLHQKHAKSISENIIAMLQSVL